MGTVGIILRSFREKIIDKRTVVPKIGELRTNSSLFITQDLIDYIINEISEFKN